MRAARVGGRVSRTAVVIEYPDVGIIDKSLTGAINLAAKSRPSSGRTGAEGGRWGRRCLVDGGGEGDFPGARHVSRSCVERITAVSYDLLLGTDEGAERELAPGRSKCTLSRDGTGSVGIGGVPVREIERKSTESATRGSVTDRDGFRKRHGTTGHASGGDGLNRFRRIFVSSF